MVLPEACLRFSPSGRGVGLQAPYHHLAKKPTPRVHKGNATVIGAVRGVIFFEQWHEEHMVQYTGVATLNKCIEQFRQDLPEGPTPVVTQVLNRDLSQRSRFS